MAKRGLIRKIIDLIMQADLLEDDEEQIESKPEVESKFVIPSAETLQLIEDHQPLTAWQINEILNYIKSNYYFSDEKNVLDDFAFQWTLCEGDSKQIFDRMSDACARIVSDLRTGKRINPADALWISYNIYAEDTNFNRMRIISKKMYGDCVVFDVTSQDKDANIANQINKLKKQLNMHNYSKPFANVL